MDILQSHTPVVLKAVSEDLEDIVPLAYGVSLRRLEGSNMVSKLKYEGENVKSNVVGTVERDQNVLTNRRYLIPNIK